MSEFSAPRLGTGIHTGGGAFRRGRGGREPIRWEILFPRGKKGILRLCGVGVALAVAVGGVILGLSLRGDPSASPDGGGPSQNGALPVETTAEAWDTADTRPPEEEIEGSSDGGAETESVTDPETNTSEPDGAETSGEDSSAVTDEASTAEPFPEVEETEPSSPEWETQDDEQRPVPEGCYPIVPSDVSESQRGVGYLMGETEGLPSSLPQGALWTGDTPPTVLLIHTHPFEGYGDGKAWYDPASGGLAQTESIHDPRGVVALGAALARDLRERGITVMHLRIGVTPEDTAAAVYERTRAAVNSYLTLYPDIGLILDLRRSAELTSDGAILRTAGELDGDTCAQVRISVSGDRSEEAVGRDLAAALALRGTLWDVSPTVSRPVWVRSGSGITGERGDVCTLTLELGSAGNTLAEAARLTAPLAHGVSRLIGAERDS